MRNTKDKGKLAESLAESFLKRKGFEILAKNFHVKHKELDIIALKSGKLVVFEVKSVSRETFDKDVLRETYDPSHNLTEKKLKNLIFATQAYLRLHGKHFRGFEIKLITVIYSKKEKRAQFKIYDLL